MVTTFGRSLAIVIATLLTLAIASPAAAQSAPKRVLILNSFEREFAPFGTFADLIRSELKTKSSVPVTFFEMSLQLALTPGSEQELQSATYLQSIFADQRLDLMVTIGGNAAQFVDRYRGRVFPTTPTLHTALNSRRVPARRPGDNSTAVALDEDFPQMIQNILDVRPETTRVFIVIGTSAFEQFWRQQLPPEFERFSPRLTIEWSNQMSLDEILARASSLPPHSAILYGTLVEDTKGVVQTDQRVLSQLHDAANAPIFGLYDVQIGQGIVGGAMTRIADSSRTAADLALRILNGERPDQIRLSTIGKGMPTYDWRELQRWGITEARLPAGSTVLFRQPSVWDQYKAYIVGATLIVGLQTALIAGLAVQRVRRRRAEVELRRSYEQNQDLAGRLINAQEQERTRIARDLHDDLSQQLAGFSIMLSGVKRKVAKSGVEPDVDQTLTTLQDRAGTLAETVRNLSHQLHPSVLEHAGLVATLRRHCAETEQHHHVTVTFTAGDSLDALTPDVALCLFRVAQEALTNAVRHARARTIHLQLMATSDGVDLRVNDDGIGFLVGERSGTGLGLRSIDERVRLARGHVTVESRPGHGTQLSVRIPLSIPQAEFV